MPRQNRLLSSLLNRAGLVWSNRRVNHQTRSRVAHRCPQFYGRVPPAAHIHLQTADWTDLSNPFLVEACMGSPESICFAYGC